MAALFGFLLARMMPLHAVLARGDVPMAMMGTVVDAIGAAWAWPQAA